MLAPVRLSAEGARVLGSLVEKELTTPGQYPLTIAALVAACNQASNRDPVVSYDDGTVISTLDALKGQRLVRFVLPSHGRSAVRYRHVLDETLALDARQRALLAVLLLRGPQTIGELRLRTDRMAAFEGLGEVEHELGYLAAREEPLTSRLGRRPGQKEERWDCPLVAPATDAVGGESGLRPDAVAETQGTDGSAGVDPPPEDREDLRSEVADLRSEVAALRSEVGELRRELAALRASLGG
jgi:uncharacterized protein YceH (UPF0502 family)